MDRTERSQGPGICERWSAPDNFSEPDDICKCMLTLGSVAAWMMHVAGNLHNTVMASERSAALKLPAVVLIDALLLPAAVVVALAETVLRLALALIFVPQMACYFFTDKDWTMVPAFVVAASAAGTLAQVPNAFLTLYQSFTSKENINIVKNIKTIAYYATCTKLNLSRVPDNAVDAL